MTDDLTIEHAITTDDLEGGALAFPLTTKSVYTERAVAITILNAEGEEAASLLLTVDGDKPVLRVWDGENGPDNDPIIDRTLVLTGKEE